MRFRNFIVLAAVASMLGQWPGVAAADDQSVAEEILGILKSNGQIDATQYSLLMEKARSEASALPAVGAGETAWTDRITLFGDFRGRYEGFFYNRDDAGVRFQNGNRQRYRLRLGLKANINKRIDAVVRLASGSMTNAISRNQSLGGNRNFLPAAINIDQAYLVYHPFDKDQLPLGASRLNLLFGKMPNVFRSKIGKDYLIWDADITPEGVAVDFMAELTEQLKATIQAGYFVIVDNFALRQMNSTAGNARNPALYAAHLQLDAMPTEQVDAGANFSFYSFRSLDSTFLVNGQAAGNIPGGLTHSSHANIGDVRAWLRCSANEDFPVLLYGNYAQNFTARDTAGFAAGKEGKAWSFGLEVGDKKKIGKLGALYGHIEANAVVATYTDSDLFDNKTNAKGWAIYGARQIFPNTDLKFSLFIKKALDKGITADTTVSGSDRKRVQGDVVVKF